MNIEKIISNIAGFHIRWTTGTCKILGCVCGEYNSAKSLENVYHNIVFITVPNQHQCEGPRPESIMALQHRMGKGD